MQVEVHSTTPHPIPPFQGPTLMPPAILTPILMCGFSNTIKTFYNTSLVSYNLTQFSLSTSRWHQIPQVKGSVLQYRPPSPSDANRKLRLSPGLLTDQLYIRSSNDPPALGSINLLGHLTELRETFYLLDYWFIIKGYNSGTARWKRDIGQGMGKGGWSFSYPATLLAL